MPDGILWCMTCSAPDCDRPKKAKGLCEKHYKRAWRGWPPEPTKRKNTGPCLVEGCDHPSRTLGLCTMHYQRHRAGNPSMEAAPIRQTNTGSCSVEGCDGPWRSKGFCENHYRDFLAGRTPTLRPAPHEGCLVPDCPRPHNAMGYCHLHYERQRIHGMAGPAGVMRGISTGEQALADFVRSLGVEVQQGARKVIPPSELDVYLPGQGVGIEFNGLHWHSDRFKERGYHRDKLRACQEAGVTLIQVWEDDWATRRPVVEKMLRRKILGADRRMGARETRVDFIPRQAATDFLEAEHIQGPIAGAHYVALRDDREVLAVGVFRRRADGVAELARYASSVTVVGGLQKMMSALPYEEFVTFSDNCISDGGLYRATGWIRDGDIPPDYRYVVDGARRHKFNYRKARFWSDPGLMWEDGLTERELAALNGIPRIWDAGKVRWTWRKS